MIDAPGPWGTGPFTLVEGHSILIPEQAIISREPFAATYLWREERTPRLRLVANAGYWDRARGPHLQELIFRNDLSPEQALELVCTTEGEVDIVTEVAPAAAARVEASAHARLVAIDAIRAVAGVIDRDADGLPLGDARARRALNLAIDRGALVREALFGRAKPLAGLTPPAAVPLLDRVLHPLFAPYAHDPARAGELWRAAGGAGCRPLRIATWEKLGAVAARVAADLRAALGVEVEFSVYGREEQLVARRRLATRERPGRWDILILEHGPQAADGPPLELHRAFVGADGEYRAGPVVPAFAALYAELVGETVKLKQAEIAHRIDTFVHDEALALFLCAPQALYAVNNEVDFTPHATTFELAQTTVSAAHWSRRDAAPTA